ncbi:anthranilate phosphoribosyltransferase [Thiotrichales bacterium 19S3-7]|nr:anthranilate phosphoribosyltransferase [Thiotrichales bacterium 19S3-7]MCF6802106.1 anthranilate phosphoribosyltransferase [Thiotrichales bacterium 19S3-11]
MIDKQIEQLLDEEVELKDKIKIVTALNKFRYDGHALAQIASIFLDKSVSIDITNLPQNTMDIVGTGGDGYSTLNYSTLTALILSQLGIPVIKHGNRSSTSRCGSFDFLETIGIEFPKTTEEVIQQFNKEHCVFLYAPYFHPLFKQIVPVRKHFSELGQKTVFNILGPLLNPARVKRMVVGVYEEALIEPMAIALNELNVEYASIVHGAGMDEFSTCGINHLIQIKQGRLNRISIHPEQLGFKRAKAELLKAGDSYQNVKESLAILNGELMGPKRDMLVINVAAALSVSTAFELGLSDAIKKVETYLQSKPVLFPHPVMH